MFNCYLHGWSSRESVCPACFPQDYTTSSTGTTTTITIEPTEPIERDSFEKLVRDLADNRIKISPENNAESCALNKYIERAKRLLSEEES